MEDDLDKRRHALLLRLASLPQRFRQIRLGFNDDAFETADFGHLCVAEMWVEFGADEIVVVPKDRISLLRAPLIVAEGHHRDSRPLFATDRAHLAHGNSEGAVAGEADASDIRIAEFGAYDRGEPITARPEQARRQGFPALIEHRIRIADGAVVPDVARDDAFLRKARLNV